jgi:RRXRR protein
MPCTPARARMLLRGRKAAVLRRYPFTIILKACSDGDLQPIELKADPGSKVTGVALVADYAKRGKTVVWAKELQHRGRAIKDALDSRRGIRRGRRNRKTRYRTSCFYNPGPEAALNECPILLWLAKIAIRARTTLPQPNSGTRTFRSRHYDLSKTLLQLMPLAMPSGLHSRLWDCRYRSGPVAGQSSIALNRAIRKPTGLTQPVSVSPAIRSSLI